MPTIDEQIADVDAKILKAAGARAVRDGDKSVERQDLSSLRALRSELVRRKGSRTGRSMQTVLQVMDE